jgi:hypothetical protein
MKEIFKFNVLNNAIDDITDTSNNEILKISINGLNRIILNIKNKIKIYETFSTHMFVNEENINLKENVNDLSFINYGNGNIFFGICTSQGFQLYMKLKNNDKNIWDKFYEEKIENCNTFTSNTNSVLVSFGNYLYVYTKWFPIQNSSLYFTVLNNQIGLPNYHPKILIDLLMYNKFDIVGYVK